MIVIVGTTAVGKTKLSVELAKRLVQGPHEIISADSVQIYRDLPITSAMVTQEEAQGIKHHILDFLEPAETFSANEFITRATPIIHDLQNDNRIAVVAGGTFLWVEGLVYENLMSSNEETPKSTEFPLPPGQTPYAQLQQVDPVLALRIHPNDAYRIQRGLDFFKQTGKPMSKQMEEMGGKYGNPRFDALFLWLDAHQDVLDARINSRVDEMAEEGMVEEVLALHKKLVGLGWTEHDPAKFPVTQTFGFTAFLPYLLEEERSAETLARCVAKYKNDTRKYAKKQKRWIQNRLQKIPAPVYRFDASNKDTWSDQVLAPALEVCAAFLEGKELPAASTFANLSSLPPIPKPSETVERWETQVFACNECEKQFIGKHQWEEHMGSQRHKRKVKYLKNRERLAEKGYIPKSGENSKENLEEKFWRKASIVAAFTIIVAFLWKRVS